MSENKERFYNQPWFIFLIAAVVVVLIVAFFIGYRMVTEELTLAEVLGFKEPSLDYLNDDLTEYIEIDREDYSNYELTLNISKPGERELNTKILKLLADKKGSILYSGTYQHDKPINAGDKAFIWYVGYVIEDGVRREINFTNFGNSIPDEYIVGSGTTVKVVGDSADTVYMPYGFDLGLIGKMPNDCADFVKSDRGNVRLGDVVYATATYMYEDGIIHPDEKIRIDLSDPDYEKIWGSGVYDIIINEKTIGMTNDTLMTLDLVGSDDRITYAKFKVDYVTRCEDQNQCVTFEAQFPYDFEDKSLANKTVYFDVYIEETLCYETAEFNDAFVTDVLKINEKKLASFEGETLADKCRAYYMSELLAEYEDNYKFLAIDTMWEYLNSRIEIKKYPQKEVKRIFEDYVFAYNLGYIEANSSGAGYESVDEYIAVVELGMPEGTNWDPVLHEKVQAEVKEKLIFYYILREEGFVPTDEEFKEYYRRELELDYKYYSGKTALDFETAAEYDAALAAHEETMIDYYGSKTFYSDEVYYLFASEKMLSLVTVKNAGEN